MSNSEFQVNDVQGMPVWQVHEFNGIDSKYEDVWKDFPGDLNIKTEKDYAMWVENPWCKRDVAPDSCFSYEWTQPNGSVVQYRMNFEKMKQERDVLGGIFSRNIRRPIRPNYEVDKFLGYRAMTPALKAKADVTPMTAFLWRA